MIPDEIISEIRERTDIVALIEEFVPLKKAGTSFKGLCPFHAEKTPSFHVHRDRQFFYCFGCQASGDVFRFLMRLEGKSFPEAVEALAGRAGIEVPRLDSRQGSAQQRERQREARWLALMESAAAFYVGQRKQEELGRGAREELTRRRITETTAEDFRLGYAAPEWDGLCRHLRSHEFSLDDAELLGLVVRRKRGEGHYDRFRHRLMFPVTDHQGRVVAFSGRLLPSEEPPSNVGERAAKYVNSPEGPLYHKGRVLYGLHQSRVPIRRKGWSVLCEGNFDLVALHQAGLTNTVAPMGTALTESQCALLRRFCDGVVLLFDGDSAGKQAARKAFPLLAEAGFKARVGVLPAGMDPDDFIRQKGPEAVTALVQQAPGITEYLIDQAAFSAGPSAAERAGAIGELGPVLMKVDSPVEVQLYIERIGQKFGVSDLHAVRTQLRRGVRQSRGGAGRRAGAKRAIGSEAEPVQQQRSPGSTPATRVPNSKVPKLEAELVGAILDNPGLIRTGPGEKLRKLLTNGDLQAIFDSAFRVTAEQPALTVPALLEDISTHPKETSDTLSVAGQQWLEQRLTTPEYDAETATRVLTDGVTRLERFSIEQRLPILSRQIMEAQRQGETERAADLLREKDKLRAAAVQLQVKN